MRASLVVLVCLQLWGRAQPSTPGGAAGDCGPPPPLPNGDVRESLKLRYRDGERVQLVCQAYHVMRGGPFQTCSGGQWHGDVQCLRPCTVNRDLMEQHNIRFKYTREDKLYLEHDDSVTFACARGRPLGSAEMRQRCVDGAVALPTCQ